MRALGGTCALVAVLLIPAACGAVADEATTSSSAPDQLQPTASPAPTGREVHALPAQDQEYVVLKGARYALPLPPFLITAVDVPNSWSVHQGHYLSAAPVATGDGRFFVTAAPEDTTAIPADPCSDHERYTIVGPSERDLANALGRQPFLEGSSPRRVVIGGREGAYVRLEVPKNAGTLDCVDSWVDLYTQGAPDDAWRMPSAAGAVARLWILDVDGERYVVHAESDPDATRHDVAVLRRMVESLTFERVG